MNHEVRTKEITRLNQFKQDLNSLQMMTIKTKSGIEKNQSESTCHSERRSRWDTCNTSIDNSSRRNYRDNKEKGYIRNRNIYEYQSITPSPSPNSNKYKNSNEIHGNFTKNDLKNEEELFMIIKDKFSQIIKNFKDEYLGSSGKSILQEKFFEIKKSKKSQMKINEQLNDFLTKNVKEIIEIFNHLDECYNSTIKSYDFLEKLLSPILKIFEQNKVSILFLSMLKEEFYNVILNDTFIKEITEEIEKRDITTLRGLKILIKTIKEEFYSKQFSIDVDVQKGSSKRFKDTKKEISHITNLNLSFKNYLKKNRNLNSSLVVSPMKSENCAKLNQINEKTEKGLSDWVDYINEDESKSKNTKKNKKLQKKNMKRKNSQMKKIKKENIVIEEYLDEIEEFKRKIAGDSVKGSLVDKVQPNYSKEWLNFIQSY